MSVAASSLITLTQAKTLLDGYTGTTLDTAVENIIDSVSAAFNRYLRRALAKTTYTNLYLDGNGLSELWLPHGPVTVLTSLYEDDERLTEGIDYDFMLYAGDAPSYLPRIVKNSGGAWLKGSKTVKLTMNPGFVVQGGTATSPDIALPEDIAYACKVQVAVEVQRRAGKSWTLSSTSFEGGTVNRYEAGALVKEVRDLLDPYRIYTA